jgi:hypothetical protein
MVRIVLDLDDEGHPTLVPARQASATAVREIEHDVQFPQVAARKPHVYAVSADGHEHRFPLLLRDVTRGEAATVIAALPRQSRQMIISALLQRT